ncbi:unnamed protein product, partial [marine sediment metagenome]
ELKRSRLHRSQKYPSLEFIKPIEPFVSGIR